MQFGIFSDFVFTFHTFCDYSFIVTLCEENLPMWSQEGYRIFMFVCKKMPKHSGTSQGFIGLILLVTESTISTIELFGVTALFGVIFGSKQTSESDQI